jgi:hypothetical protein
MLLATSMYTTSYRDTLKNGTYRLRCGANLTNSALLIEQRDCKMSRTTVSIYNLCSIYALYCFSANHVYTPRVQDGVVSHPLARLSCATTTIRRSCQATAWVQTSTGPTWTEPRKLRDLLLLQHGDTQKSPTGIQGRNSGGPD